MKKLFVLFILGFSSMSFGQQSHTSSERGLFSVEFFGGYDLPRLLNTDGSYASYKGSSYGAAFDVQLWGSGAGEFRFFGQYEAASAGGIETHTDKLKREKYLLGMKVFANENLFLAAGLGNAIQKYTNTVSTTTLKHRVTQMGAGFEFAMSKSWFMSVAGYYQSGPIGMSGNALSSNSFFESMSLQLGIIWSPPISITTYNSK